MKNITNFTNKKVLVLGLAKSGESAARLLDKLGAIVTVNDGKPFEENPAAQSLLEEGIKVVTGGHPLELLDEDFELMVKNPGIPYDNAMVVRALEKKIPVITEVELAYLISEAPIIGITGSNGKTTTTTMIAQVLTAGGQNGLLSGNIGFPASQVAQTASSKDTLVMELSSFQLMGIEDFHPQIAVITNLMPTHLDYHGSVEEYAAAKWNIQKNMTADDYLVLNFNQETFSLAKVINTLKALKAGGIAVSALVIDGMNMDKVSKEDIEAVSERRLMQLQRRSHQVYGSVSSHPRFKALKESAQEKLLQQLDVADEALRHELAANPELIDELLDLKDSKERRAWIKQILEGIAFNKERAPFYLYNEVYLESPKAGKRATGKSSTKYQYVRLDSYNPRKGEIVSRKYTQLSEISEETAIRYLKELKDKYSPGAVIADVPSNRVGANAGIFEENGGNILKGRMILEVPVQKEPIPESVLRYAAKEKIEIRDTNGKIYSIKK